MQISFKPSRLSNLYKPLIILLSTYVLVNLAGFFVQHDFGHQESSRLTISMRSADEFLVFEEKVSVTPAPPEIKVKPTGKILPSGEIEGD